MAIFLEYTPELQKQWDDWVATRPPVIQEMCTRVQPNKLYLLKETGQRVTISSLNENGTVTVQVSSEFNPQYKGLELIFERAVFGVSIDALEECDLPEGWQPTT